jgi:RimJ/RimL family protein N-acetyltransferase
MAVLPEMARATITDRAHLAKLLNAHVPEDFPPKIMADVMSYFAERLEQDPELVGWWVWYILLKQATQFRTVIGTVGFNGYPDLAGYLLMGYFTLSRYEGQGYTTEAAAGLLRWAFQQPQVEGVMAETFPTHIASVRVMKKNGMVLLGTGSEPGTVKYGITRDRYFSTSV